MKKNKRDSEFVRRIDDLIEEFEKSPDPRERTMGKFARNALETHDQLEESLGGLQESLDYLRVCIKYIVFDLEATRRENEYLRKLLEGEEDRDVTD